MDEKRFWSMIEDAWRNVEGGAEARKRLAAGELNESAAEELAQRATLEFIPALSDALEQLSRDDLLQFDRVLERKLYDIDRSEIHEYTDGSDDGFLYCRGFIVAAGQAFYDAVSGDPSRAIMDAECEDMCYLSCRVYLERFGEMPRSGISRESVSNKAGWPEFEK